MTAFPGAPTPPDGPRPPDGRDRATALAEDLADLAAATDELTDAVERHDLVALLAANHRAEVLTAQIRDLSADLTDADRARVDTERVLRLRGRIDLAARRNAYLIERAWAVDASTMRLLATLGRPAGGLPVHSYAPPPGPGYLDRQA